jgi:2-phospho-L-lactate/phosphoenolpyruvate guanylyltransferase
MRTVAVLPIKSFGAAKQRLSATLRGGSRHILAQSMFFDVLAALRRSRRLDAVAVVTDDHEVEAVLRGDPVTVLRENRRAGQSAAAAIGIDHALAEGFQRVLLVPGDTPLLDPEAIDHLLESTRADRVAVTIVPDRHGEGTNALLLSPPEALAPSFGPGSLERHVTAAREAQVSYAVEEVECLMLDVDTPDDLVALVEQLERSRGLAPRTRGALRQFDRLDLRPLHEPGTDEAPEPAGKPKEHERAAAVTAALGEGWPSGRNGSDHQAARA